VIRVVLFLITYHTSLITIQEVYEMKRFTLTACGVALALTFGAGAARAQSGTVATGPDPSTVRDVESDASAKHELEVARHYFKNKKAYYAAFKRCEELAAGYPEFYKLDEVLYIAGMSSLYLSEGKGKQKLPAATPEKAQELSPESLRANARDYLSRLVNDFPKSGFRKDAEEALSRLGGEKPKEEHHQ
jgi:outer membrane protein assembly factor BamD (BamD/ComL family)